MNKVNILLVDDRPEGLISLEAVLNDSQYNLIKANSGQEALAQVLKNDFAVILMDVQMPEMDGIETTTIIKQREKSKNIPVIFMTANNVSEQNIIKGYSVGAVDYVLKPFDEHILKSKVAVFVELHKKNQLIQEQTRAIHEIERRERMRILHDLENEGRRRYQNLADAVPQILFRANALQQIEYFNQFWVKYTGLNHADSKIDLWKQAFQQNDLQVFLQEWDMAISSQQGFELECRIKQANDEYRWHLLRIIPEFDAEINLTSWLGVASDIHDQKLVQEELILAKKLAEVANETKSNFLANMSHEIRTPLGVILGFSELLIDTKIAPEEKIKLVSSIKRNGEHLSRIIDEILDLSKVESGKMDMEQTDIQLLEFLDSLRCFFSVPAKNKNLRLEFEILKTIPSTIVSCSTRLHQILVNLIGNAIKFSDKGAVSVITSTEKYKDQEHLIFQVQDSGPGLTEEQIKKLFQPFSQVDASMTRKHGGTGLGLALSQKLARAMDGEISVKPSAAGEGCNFIVRIPVTVKESAHYVSHFKAQVCQHSAAKVKEEKNALENMKILLVEDSLDNQDLFSVFLSMAGAQVDIANNGEEGVKKALNGNFDVILMDIQMPILNGYDAIKKLRDYGYAKPIVALTAHGMVDDKNRCLEVGSNDHVTKPVDRKTLIDTVQNFQNLGI